MVLVAVSGGRDSMLLAQKVRLSGGPFAMAHCNFGLRGAESDADEAFVREWAAAAGVTCHVRRFDTAGYAASEGISIEMAARQQRYRWFGELCREFGYEAVLTAHHADDEAETFFLNLLRGTGVKGLCGMPEESFLPDPSYADIPLHRPLIGMTRAEIDAEVSALGIPFREDSTNAENAYRRNKLRNEVFPLLREINPSFETTLREDMQRLRMVSDIADAHYREHAPLVWDGKRVDTALLQTFSHWEYILYRILENEGLEPALAASAADIVRSGRSGRHIGPFVSAAGRLVRVQEVGEPRIQVIEEAWESGRSPIPPAGELLVDADRVRGELVADRWSPGDWIRPLGMRGRRKLQDWFKDRRFSLVDKQHAVIVRDTGLPDAHHAVAVLGGPGVLGGTAVLGGTGSPAAGSAGVIDDAYRITATTRRVFRIKALE